MAAWRRMEGLRDLIGTVAAHAATLPPLVLAAAGAALAAMLGAGVRRRLPWTGGLLRMGGNLVLVAVLLLVGLRFVRLDPDFDAVLPSLGFQQQQVVGGETRVPLSPDGHYWIEAKVNGRAQRFMVDTGATLSALSEDAAEAAGVAPDPLRVPVMVHTANGAAEAQLARISTLRFGSVEARNLDAIITGTDGGLNVLGMNFLRRLKGWRVEDGVLILTPTAKEAAAAR